MNTEDNISETALREVFKSSRQKHMSHQNTMIVNTAYDIIKSFMDLPAGGMSWYWARLLAPVPEIFNLND